MLNQSTYFNKSHGTAWNLLNISFLSQKYVFYNGRKSPARRVSKQSERLAESGKLNDRNLQIHIENILAASKQALLFPESYAENGRLFIRNIQFFEVCGLVISTVTLVRTMPAISRFYFFILRQKNYEINNSLHVTLQCSSQ